MLHTKFRENRPACTGEDFGRVFTIYGRGDHLGHVTWTIYVNFLSPFPMRLHINLALIGQAVSEKKMFEHCGRRQTDGRRTLDHGYTISSPCKPNGSGELKSYLSY